MVGFLAAWELIQAYSIDKLKGYLNKFTLISLTNILVNHFTDRIKSFFITISQDQSFLDKVKENINKKNKVLVICAAGGRSIIAANLLANEGYNTLNVSDGYSGNGQDPGWKNLGLPSVIDN